jgi:hypothetical protein
MSFKCCSARWAGPLGQDRRRIEKGGSLVVVPHGDHGRGRTHGLGVCNKEQPARQLAPYSRECQDSMPATHIWGLGHGGKGASGCLRALTNVRVVLVVAGAVVLQAEDLLLRLVGAGDAVRRAGDVAAAIGGALVDVAAQGATHFTSTVSRRRPRLCGDKKTGADRASMQTTEARRLLGQGHAHSPTWMV